MLAGLGPFPRTGSALRADVRVAKRGGRRQLREWGMSDLLAARSQMAMSLAFHIVFAVAGMGMPLLMVLSEWRWLRHGREVALLLTKRWAKGTAVLFAVGAVSGTVLSYELGLLWPKFMGWAGG